MVGAGTLLSRGCVKKGLGVVDDGHSRSPKAAGAPPGSLSRGAAP